MEPRDHLLGGLRMLFGRSDAAQWRAPTSPDEVVAGRAAQMQHDAALALWQTLRSRNIRIGDFAERSHVNAEGMRRKLRGETWAGLRDLALWQLEVERE